MKRMYMNKNCDLKWLAGQIERWFLHNFFEVQIFQEEKLIVIQARKENLLRSLFGARRAYIVTIEGKPDNFEVEVGVGKWFENIASAGIIGLLASGTILFYSSAIMAAWTKVVSDRLWEYIDQEIMTSQNSRNNH